MTISKNLSMPGHAKRAPLITGKTISGWSALIRRAGAAACGIIILTSAFFAAVDSMAAEAEKPLVAPATAQGKLPLSLQKAIQLALENNLDIIIEKVNPQVSEAQIEVEKGIFDPSLTSSSSAKKSVTPTGSALAGAPTLDVDTSDFSAAIGQKTPLGGTYGLRFGLTNFDSTSRFQTLHPQHTTTLDLSVTQPLLRNFGVDVTKSRIRIAQYNRDISKSKFEEKVMDILTQAENSYWDLVFSIGELEVRLQALKLARDLIEINKAQVAVGALAPIEILQAETSAAARGVDVIQAESAIQDVMDRLKNITGLARDPAMKDIFTEPIDKPPFVVKEISVDETIAEALKRNPSVIQKLSDIETRKTNLLVARNAVLPQVDFQGGAGLNGLSGESDIAERTLRGGVGNSLDNLFSGDFFQWQVGLSFQFPIGNRIAKSNKVRAALELDRSRDEMRNLEESIRLSVRNAVRAVTTNAKKVNSATVARTLAERQLDAEQKKFNVGLSTNFRVLTFQDDLAKARSTELKAIIDYNESLVNLDRVKGATLERNHIDLKEDKM